VQVLPSYPGGGNQLAGDLSSSDQHHLQRLAHQVQLAQPWVSFLVPAIVPVSVFLLLVLWGLYLLVLLGIHDILVQIL
jgi:hypothetical protein